MAAMRRTIALLLTASAVLAQAVPVQRGNLREVITLSGKFAPATPTRIRIETQRYGGKMELASIVESGAWVEEGDVIARIDPKPYREHLESQARALEAAEMAHRHALLNAEIKREERTERLDAARRNAERAQKRLKGWHEFEKEFQAERERLARQSREHSMENARDELDQLEKMYRDDELVDETEDIVLKRSRRGYASRKANQELAERQRKYNKEWYEPEREEDRVLRAEAAVAAYERTKRRAEMEAEKEKLDLAAKTRAIEKKREEFKKLEEDGERLVLQAPHAGLVVLASASLKKGARVQNRQEIAQIVKESKLALEVEIAETEILSVSNDLVCEVEPTAMPGKLLAGRLEVATLPTAKAKFPATIRLSDAPKALRPGMTGKATIIVRTASNALMVPTSAVRDGKVQLEGGEWVEVETGIRDGTHVEIKSGLSEGDRIVPAPGAPE